MPAAPSPAPVLVPLDALSWPALLADAEGGLLALNSAAVEAFGASPPPGRMRLEELLPAGPALQRLAERAASTDATVHEAALAWRGPQAPAAEATAAALADGRVLVCIHPPPEDEAGHPSAELLSTAAGLGRTLAHEIKNPLAGIRGAAQLLRGDAADGPGVELAQLIMDETDRIRRLVDQVEAFSDDRPPSRRPVNLHRVLERVRSLTVAAASRPLRVRERYDPSLPHADGDEDQLVQVFLNLARNAADAAGEGGEVVFATAYRHGARARTEAPPGWRATPLEVRIEDDGPGVDPSVRLRLFSPFVTTKATGSGLGLTVVAKLVAAHGGVVDFHSEAGRTVFRVLLPVGEVA